jgi:hypothetical protein
MVGVKSYVNRISADRAYLLHVSNAVFEDEGFRIESQGWYSTRRREAVDIAVKEFKVEKVLERQG